MTTDPQEINSHFRDIYSLLYRSEQNKDLQTFDSLFSQINMPQIWRNQKENLHKELTSDELNHLYAVWEKPRPRWPPH